MRLIDADKLLENSFKNPISYNAFCNLVKRQMTVDAVPVRHGRWEWNGEAFVCSACGSGYKGQPTMMGKPMFEFCPICGADMRKDGDGK